MQQRSGHMEQPEIPISSQLYSFNATCFGRSGDQLSYISLKLDRASFGGVVLQYSMTSGSRNLQSPRFIQSREDLDDIVGAASEKNLASRDKEFVKPRPAVAYYRCAACRSFKQPNTRRIAGGRHMLARQVERIA
jgi:hypothetical protein